MENRNTTLFFLISLLFFSCGKGGMKKIVITETMPERIVKNFSIDKYISGDKIWQFTASRADIYDKRNTVYAIGVDMLYYESSVPGTAITASSAVININTGDVSAFGNVVINSLSGNTTLYTEAINYDGKTKKIISDSFVRHERSDATITGQGMTASGDLSEVIIQKDVRVIKK
ncbi:MAG: Lipopolysaccharide-assembly, LptC-related [Elusimicrobia bacterium ADurb.Bin231]|nr:MAG: Lipopolysaccharide-assembly, LptC-related [Elusimicrobia bacterium ADurb.Bin231]